VPNLAKRPLALSFPPRGPAPGAYRPGTAEFRYWTAAEALRRAADFWAPRVPSKNWQIGPTLPVILDEGEDLNAYYDRKALNFFHGDGPGGTVYSGESPDVICHELGHAVLDSIKPELWDAASDEAAAFHEAFGDMSAILSALQLPSLRSSILSDTKGHLYRSTRLSRLAEQLGDAIRAVQPDAVDRDCLRNVVNSFTYTDPLRLPQSAPASQISSEPHSFSRVFSGSFFEALAGMLAAKAAKPEAPTEQELLATANDAADILIAAVRHASVVPNFYAQVAAGMVGEAAHYNAKYPAVLKGVFVRRSILSLRSALHVEALHSATAGARNKRIAKPGVLEKIALAGQVYNLQQPLLVHVAGQPRSYVVDSGHDVLGQWEPPSSATAARAFVDNLFQRGSVEHVEHKAGMAYMNHGRRLKTHRVRPKRDDNLHLERCMFDCNFCYGGRR